MPPKATGTIYGTFKSMLVGNTVRHLNRDVSQRLWTAGACAEHASFLFLPDADSLPVPWVQTSSRVISIHHSAVAPSVDLHHKLRLSM